MSSPLVTIVTPSYNQREFIKDTLQSVQRQKYPQIEHLVMDGGSTDNTVDLLRDFEGNYNLRWWSESDDGQSHAINKGFERASGDIVAWLNSDDVYFDTGVIGRIVKYFNRFPEDIIYGDLAYIDENSTVTGFDVRPEFDVAKLPYRVLIGQPATFFRKSVVEAEKLDEELHYSMDYEYWLRLSQDFTFRHVEDVLAGFRSYDTQKSQNMNEMAAELSTILEEYKYPDRETASVVMDNLSTEARRLLRAYIVTVRLSRKPPKLAFDGEFASLASMITNVGPGFADALKGWQRWRSKGSSG